MKHEKGVYFSELILFTLTLLVINMLLWDMCDDSTLYFPTSQDPLTLSHPLEHEYV